MTTGFRAPDASRVRVVASCLAGLALLLFVAAVARDAGGAEAAPPGDLPSLDGLAAALGILGVVAMGAMVVAVLLTGAVPRGRTATPLHKLLGAVAMLAALWLFLGSLPTAEDAPTDEGEAAAGEPEEPAATATDDGLPAGPVLLAAVAAMALGGLVLARILRQAGGQPEGDDEGEDGADDEAVAPDARRRIVTGLDDLVRQIRADPDARRAVIRAWAGLEDLLAGHHLPRRPAEAPTTYVGRVLERLTASRGPVDALTTTFERAMFSPHTVRRADQLAAVEALLAVRDDLGERV